MGDFKLKIDIAKPDVAAAERGLKSIFKELDKIDKKADSVDRKMKRIGGAGTGGKGVVSAKANSKFGQGILSGLGIGTGAAAALTAIRALGGAITAAGASAKRAAVDFAEFQNNIVSISRISGIAESEVASMSQDFLELSSAIPVSSSELQKFAEIASRFGIKGREGVQAFAETFGRLQSIIGPVSEETTKSVARIASLTDFPIEEIDKFANAVVVLGKNFATTEDQIIRTGERLAGDLSQFGITADEVLGLATAFDSLGVKAELGGSAMVRILNSITKTGLRGGSNLERLAELAGETTESFKEMALISRIDAFSQLIKGGGSATEIMDRLNLSGVRVQGVLGRLISRNDKFSESMAQSNKEMMDNNVLMRDSDRQADTLESRFNRLSNAVTAAFISIGGEGSDANGEMEGLTDTLIGMAEAFSGVESDAAKMFPNMESLGDTFRDLFKDGVKSVGEMLKGFDKMTPAIEGIANSLSTVVSLLGKAANLYGDFNNADIKDYMAGFAEFISFGTYQAEIENIPLDNPEAATLIEIGKGRRNALGGNGTAGEWGVDNGTFGEWEDGTEDIFKKAVEATSQLAEKNIPALIAQIDKYADKANDINFATDLMGLSATEKRLAQLQQGFDKRVADSALEVKKARDLIKENEESHIIRGGRLENLVDDKELQKLKDLVAQSDKMKDAFKDVKSALEFRIAKEEIEAVDDALDKINKQGEALFKRKQDINKGPAPDVNAITDIESTAAFIASSKRADKDTAFRKQQLDLLIKANDIARKGQELLKKGFNTDIKIGNFRNTP
jgi:TP901 family phage tail tape measure protein